MLKKVLITLTIVLVLINIFLINTYGYYERRLIRLISIGAYFLVFIYYSGAKNKNILLVFSLLISVDILGLFFEKGLVSIIGPLIKLISYFFIIKEVIKKIKFKKINKPIYFFLGVVILLNLLLVYQTVWSTFLKINNYIESAVYIVYGSINVAVCIAALNYNFRYGTNRSIYYLYFVFALVLSDACWFIAYYLDSNSAFYFDILFYLVALCFIILYALDTKNQDDVLLIED
ncbi:hypothetical protein [uncultured Lacinutrix sp.]|uniref:hypothetical protein n=1 Tax=uncultured Lacinutrix sp. TaxID=574032 RepID=UPI002638E930|nr:hypothetical protein [uncultured Lacinutrix sp.]